MEAKEYQSGRDHVLVGERGIEFRQAGRAAVDIPWTSIGLLRVERFDDGRARLRALCAHLSDGRKVILPAPRSNSDDGTVFDTQAAEILKAWRASYLRRGSEPQDSVPIEYRRSTAREVDLSETADVVPAMPPLGDSRPEAAVYRSGLSRVYVSLDGIGVKRPTRRQVFIPWPAVRSVTACHWGCGSLWIVRVRLHDRRNVLLPAPVSHSGEHDPGFQRALAAITAVWQPHRPQGTGSQPTDRISKAALREAAGYVQVNASFFARFR